MIWRGKPAESNSPTFIPATATRAPKILSGPRWGSSTEIHLLKITRNASLGGREKEKKNEALFERLSVGHVARSKVDSHRIFGVGGGLHNLGLWKSCAASQLTPSERLIPLPHTKCSAGSASVSQCEDPCCWCLPQSKVGAVKRPWLPPAERHLPK